MFTLTGAVIGFGAMLAARGKAGIAAGLAILGIVFGIGSSMVFAIEKVTENVENLDALANVDWSTSDWLAGVMAALPGVLGALLARRD